MVTAPPCSHFGEWRRISRSLLEGNVSPADVMWGEDSLFGELPEDPQQSGGTGGDPKPLRVPPAFLKLAEEVACHADRSKWPLLYRLLWRITRGGERHLLQIASDPDMAKAAMMAKNVRREIHKMHAFVRFKLISTDEETGRERYAAWFEPDHEVVRSASPFFESRFANMDWSIFTPKGSVHWIAEELTHGPGLTANPIEDPDALESAWSTYYRSIFNPARLKTKMMQSEMPKRYWKNLPEAAQIPELIAASRTRMEQMIDAPSSNVRPAPRLPYLNQLREMSTTPPVVDIPLTPLPLDELRRLSANCRSCPLWQEATCTVFGEGPPQARIMIVGEQPGDKEDISGRPFIGPAGQLLNRALNDAGIDRDEVYVTNAVKHFKWKPRGKVRLHSKPDANVIDACRPWLLGELSAIKPERLILLGATAARAVLGHPLEVLKFRGIIPSDIVEQLILTIHPSYLLRIPDDRRKEEEYQKFVADLALAAAPAG